MNVKVCLIIFIVLSFRAVYNQPLDCPNIKCLRCPTCAANETLVVSPCNNCCLNQCVPKDIECPDPPIECLWCPPTCPAGEILVESPCGCCNNRCEPSDDPQY
ncbi:hypothetical protein ABEB36_007633 [Hypothenemus hampei]|uniref:Uncharacterized protein n=1 Tax=Hypothenemus hampei TaxID=57062 RepID=A0ABD1EX38_HYPHA